MQPSQAPNPERARLLLVDDDRSLARMLREFLELQGFDVDLVHSGEAALARIAEAAPELVVLDVTLPGLSGFEVLSRLRGESQLPVVMLTARGEESDRIAGLMGGADDYLAKPFDLEELMARVKALLRRCDRPPLVNSQQEILSYGCLTLVPERFEAIWFDQPVRLTHLEFELLHCLLQRHGQTVSPPLILKEVWGYEPDDDIETIRVHVRHLRTKLEPDPRKPRFIKTVYGAGYCLELPSDEQLAQLIPLVRQARPEAS